MFLSADELARLTGKKRFTAQCRALDRLRIRYRKAATGEPLVRADALDAMPKRARNHEPPWERWNVVALPSSRR